MSFEKRTHDKLHFTQVTEPPYFRHTVELCDEQEKKSEDYKQKIIELKAAMNDKLFLRDLKKVSEEFETIDIEGWEE